ncbi:hypothetical protein ACEWPL_015865 [Roseovarius sp. S1116L3]|uniref:hypothetical protein n=1 Tax=Roseovarius roseus TaxID=3342636 RepID=UPI00372B605B
MAETGAHADPIWFVEPGQIDVLAWVALALICLALYGLVVLYAAFDRWAERRAHGTPLAKTIPTLLTIALLYEIFPLGHFSILLPITAILIALMADWSRFHLTRATVSEAPWPDAETDPAPATTAQTPSQERGDA